MHPPKNRVESILTLFFYAWLTLMVVMYVRHNLSFAIDDSYITYRYAYHFAEGWGLVFNVGEHHYGSTAMGFAVALGSMAWLCVHAAASVEVSITIHDTIPALATVSSALSLGVVGILFHSTARCLQSPWRRCFVSIIICLYVFWGHFPIRASGHETYPFIALMLLGSHLMLQVRAPRLQQPLRWQERPWCGLTPRFSSSFSASFLQPAWFSQSSSSGQIRGGEIPCLSFF